MPKKPTPTLRTAAIMIKRAYIPTAFTKRHAAAIILGVCFGGIAGAIFMSGDQGRQPWWAVVIGVVAGATIGVGLLLAAVPRKQR